MDGDYPSGSEGLQRGNLQLLIEKGATGIEESDADVTRDRLRAYFLQDGREKKVFRALSKYLKSLKDMNPEMPHIQIDTHFHSGSGLERKLETVF